MKTNYKFWPEGRPRSLNYPEIPLFELLEQTAARAPKRRAIIFGGMEVTYGELKILSDRFAAALVDLGIKKGDRVAIHLPNCPQFAIAYYGILKTGAAFTPVSPLLTGREVERQLNDSEAKIFISLDLLYPGIKDSVSKTKVEKVITTSLADCYNRVTLSVKPIRKTEIPDTLEFTDLLEKYDPVPPQVKINPKDDIVHLAYTGGTTGPSKGCMITHYNAVVNVLQYSHWMAGGYFEIVDCKFDVKHLDGYKQNEFEIPIDKGTSLVVVPWFHAMGTIGYLNMQIYAGITMIVFPRFDPLEYLSSIEKYNATTLGGAPQLFIPLMKLREKNNIDLSNVKMIVSGSAPLPLEIITEMLDIFSGIVCEAYGMTECTMGATSNPFSRTDYKPGTVGLPVFDTEIKIIDDNGNELGVEQEGEICIKGPQVAKGYWNKPEETDNTFRDGWIHSGDIGKIDEDGYLSIVDRKKDMIIYKGYNVYPRDLEETLFEHPDIADVAVIGKPDRKGGEIPVAFIKKMDGSTLTEMEVIDFSKKNMAPYKKIREVRFIEELPRSGAGKVLKTELKKAL